MLELKQLLHPNFLARYKGRKPHWGPLGEPVYLRTYSRWNEQEQRRETWDETIARAVEFSMALHKGPENREAMTHEAQELFNVMWGLKGFVAGRTLWTGGTPYSLSEKGAAAQFNCSFTDIRKSKDFYDLAFLLMSGAGVGIRVTQDNVAAFRKAHPIRTKVDLLLKPYSYVGQPGTLEHTEYSYDPEGMELVIRIGDSREGWAEAIQAFIEIFSSGRFQGSPVNTVVLNVDHVRPLGARLRTFGGQASGPMPLVEFYREGQRVIYRDGLEWTDLKLLDLANLVGRTVVAGGTRRSAEIALGDSREFSRAKTGDWFNTTPWRSQSNNTLVFASKPSKAELYDVMQAIAQYGEPGFLNEEAAKRRRPEFRGINPCAEILLADKGFCNLVTANWMAFVRNGKMDVEGLERTYRLLTRHALRITNLDMSHALPEWHERQQRDRLLGVSFTGFGDAVDSLGMTPSEQAELLARLRKAVHDEGRRYAQKMGVNPPLLMTTVKPEGTLSQLPTVSSGVHPAYAPYYIRRIRVGRTDAVAQALYFLGFEPKPEFGSSNLEDASTWVFEFPVKTPAKRSSKDYSAVEMLERYRMIAEHWADHNPSITINFDPETETDQIVEWLDMHWDEYVAVSFLPKSKDTYPLMPYEEITKEQYEALKARTPSLSGLRTVLTEMERTGFSADGELDSSCETGVCPVR